METKMDWQRIGGACGVAVVVGELAGFAILAAAGGPATTLADSPATIARAYAQPVGTGAFVGLAVAALALFCLVGFGAALRDRLRPATDSWLPDAAFAAASLAAGLGLVSLGVLMAAVHRAGPGVDGSTATALADVASALHVLVWPATAIVLGVTAVLAPRAGLSRLVGRLSAVLAVVQLAVLAVPTSGVAELASTAVLLWFAVAGVALWRGGQTAAAADRWGASRSSASASLSSGTVSESRT